MESNECQRRCNEIERGWAELEQQAAAHSRVMEFVAEMLDEHNAQTVRDLPQHIQDAIADQLAGLTTLEQLEAERLRLERLEADMMPHIAPLLGQPN